MEENEIYAALDLEMPQGATEQETADPADLTGETEQEAADPARNHEETAADPEQPEEQQKQEQTKEERARFAAQRRKAEMDAAVKEAVEKAVKEERDRSKAEMDAFFAAAALKNTLTGKPITSMEEFNEWKQAFEAAKLQRELKAGKLTPEALQKVIEQTPAMRQVQQIAQKQQEAVKQQSEAAAKARVDAEIREIHEMDPTINELKDLLTMPNAAAFRRYVEKGNSFVDAYYLANRDEITKRKAEEAARQAVNSARSKDHLTATKTKGSGGLVDVPSSEMALFKELMPDAKPSDIKAYYNKYLAKK